MNEPGLTTVCRICGTTFATAGDGFGEVCLGCLLGAGLGSGDASESSVPVDAATPPPGGLEAHGARFAHYEISTRPDGAFVELGRGAMGVTYRAVDTVLHHEVALKVVVPEVAGNPQARARFLREAQAAASLRHPHIASVFFFGERPADRQLFYAMELIEGETLQARVARAGGLPADTVVEIGTQVADALAAAEARGLTHRDLKPANVMLSQGEKVNAKLIDFGLAKTILGEPDGATRQTRAGEFMGTPAFASPEHFNVWQDTDSRSDFYALGATLWYALTGQPPFAGRTVAEIHRRQLHDPLPLHRLQAARVPRPLVVLLRSLLSGDPTGRPQTARALNEALNRCRAQAAAAIRKTRLRPVLLVAAALGSCLALAGGSWLFHELHRLSAPSLPATDKSIAVLPFDNLSAGKDDAFFTDGVQGEILTDLAKVADLKVIGRASVMQYRGDRPRNLREIMDALGVAHVLEGSVQRAGGKVRVNAQLIDARTGTQLWAERYDRDLSDVFAIQSDIAQAIADQLQARLSAREKVAVQERPTSDLAAYDLYLHAKELFDATHFEDKSREVLPEMVRLLDEAVARDPKFVSAYCLLALAHEDIYWWGFDPTPARFARAEAALSQATRLRPDAGEVHLARAWHTYHHLDFPGAEREVEIAARTLPNNADVYTLRAYILRREGRWDESIQAHRQAISLNPRSLLLVEELYLINRYLFRYDEANRLLSFLLTLAPRDANLRADQATLDLFRRADPRAAYSVLPGLLAESPAAAESASSAALDLAMCTRDAAFGARALAATPDPEIGSLIFGRTLPRAYYEGVIAQFSGDPAKAQAAFERARNEMGGKVAEAPNDPGRLTVLGLIDAALGRKADAIAEGERSVQLLPLSKDAFEGPKGIFLLAAIYANVGEKGKAIDILNKHVDLPGAPCYGNLRLLPLWDPLRGDPRFEALVNKAGPL